jgi:hypothetical protein
MRKCGLMNSTSYVPINLSDRKKNGEYTVAATYRSLGRFNNMEADKVVIDLKNSCTGTCQMFHRVSVS